MSIEDDLLNERQSLIDMKCSLNNMLDKWIKKIDDKLNALKDMKK